MKYLASICLFVVLFGGLGFHAAAYYLNVSNPSWPFWIGLYALTSILSIRHIEDIRLSIIDIIFLLFISYVGFSFLLFGESDAAEFKQRILLYCIGPYICGRLLGDGFSISRVRILYGISFLYILLLGVEIALDPSLLFETDRIILFNMQDRNTMGGDPTTFNLGVTLGAAWLVAVVSLMLNHIKLLQLTATSKSVHLIITIVFPVTLMLFSSRSSIVAAILVVSILIYYKYKISNRAKLIIFLGLAGSISIIYAFIPEERKNLLNQVPEAITYINSLDGTAGISIIEGNAIIGRVGLIIEAWRLFWESPLYGIGAANYALYYSGVKTEFGSPHSEFAQILAECGIFGATLYVMLFYLVIWAFLQSSLIREVKYNAEKFCLFAVWLFFFLISQFSGNIYSDYHLYLLTGLLVANISFANDSWYIKFSPFRTYTSIAEFK